MHIWTGYILPNHLVMVVMVPVMVIILLWLPCYGFQSSENRTTWL